MDIILASGSPRRRELLSRAQLDFTILSVDIDETPHDNESPKDYIARMVAAKAEAAIEQLNINLKNNQTDLPESFIVLTSDTIGVLADGKTVLVKPINREHAYSMWQQMSDNTHEVWTAVQATQISLLPNKTELSNKIKPSHQQCSHQSSHEQVFQVVNQQQIIERTEVTFIALTKEMMRNYWDSGEPADKAGGYGIQGLGATWVSRINGSYTNVVGLPLAQTLALIKDMTDTGI
ncbi:nucleoside triphosphate pyrophosphatase [Psychrobacter sp. DAB_AL32B]|uniref:Maf family protein n=1 Tax=Psychrobacter sp. DAB_AL32B TaxID=1028414 RepID=UPI000B7F99D3|nr:Maf family protein [Psychrobacter sp. DAB_AL32B]OXL18398.1 septum formation inhibitor Maf [Psychrobacter sp. DAB_AL32B]